MAADRRRSPRVRSLVAVLRRSLVLILVCASAGALAGLGAGLRTVNTHTATASVLVEPLDGNPFSPTGSGDNLLNLETEAQLVRSDEVALSVIEELGLETTPAAILTGLEVSVPPNTQLLSVGYTSPATRTSIARAQAFAEAYLASREARAETNVRQQTARIGDQVDARETDLAQLTQSAGTQTGADARLTAERIDAITSQIDQLQTRASELQTGALSPGQVVTPAQTSARSDAVVLATFVLAGLFAGAVVALAVAVLRARVDPRIHGSEDVESEGLDVLGSLPHTLTVEVASAVVEGDPHGVELGDDLELLRLQLLRRCPSPAVIALVSASADESPQSGLALALSTVRCDLETILIDTSPTSGGLSSIFDLDDPAGLSDVVDGSVTPDEALVTIVPGLRLLPAGTASRRAADLYASPTARRVIEDLRANADLILLVGGAARDAATRTMAADTDAVLLEVHEGETTHRDLREIAADTDASSELLGVVYLDGPPPPRRGRLQADGLDGRDGLHSEDGHTPDDHHDHDQGPRTSGSPPVHSAPPVQTSPDRDRAARTASSGLSRG